MGLFKKKNKEEQQNNQAATAQPEVPAAPGEASPGQVLAQGMVNVRDIIAPSALEVDFSHIRIGNTYYRTVFISGYPRFVGANWLSPVINFDHTLDISMFYYPVKAKGVLEDLRKKMTEMEATVMSNQEKGRLQDPGVVAALEDARDLQEQLVKGVEKFFQFSFYITIPAESLEELENVTAKLESTLGSLLLISKSATLQMEEAFQTTIPAALDKLLITRNMDTTSLATTFPFTSSDLTSDDGIMYGVNRHNGSLVIFDRFSLENANTVVFAKSGAGKSYMVKLEALRSLVFGAEIIIIDVEEEYRTMCDAVGGDFISFSANSPSKMNPFDLAGMAVEGENELGQKILSLHTLFKLMLGSLTPTEEAILDRALIETYRIKGITNDPDTQRGKEPPVMEDLYKVLLGAEEPEAKGMAERLEKYIRGSLTGIFDSQSTINIDNRMTVFSTKNLEDVLRPVAFYIILDFIWTKIRKDLKKRILIVEEAWYLLQNEDSARFIYGIAKRARKYYLGLTTISQDVDEFLRSEYGKAIVTNSSIQILLKQHPAAIDVVAETFYLSEGEKRLLLAADKGEGLFFAGSNHVAIKVSASPEEHKLITTNPEELLKMREQGKVTLREEDLIEKPQYRPLERFAPGQGSAQPQSPPAGVSTSEPTIEEPAMRETAAPVEPVREPPHPTPIPTPPAPSTEESQGGFSLGGPTQGDITSLR
ncbi:MAG: Type IV secretory pathway VirB4 component-like protein [candidate division WWE3 bacterium GW2011_GWC1_41_7]|uniref:Type IV secretory pathway VirB4 component-like protein n=1 Tax=candidate division WWE3 bacterium GW2011_GWC1_41_7 TaxID=1619119 RepID=A0A0G0ZFX1_UNCKA|nr:MAG: Type IV secretory pathway VirB4 component-like protein [candidate division WWE3 bacterium GW2011_GWC1_41_7]